MNAFTGIEMAMAGMFLTVMVGLIGMMVWTTLHKSEGQGRRRRFQNSVKCLLCGKANKVTSQEWDRSRVICRCGQPLYLAPPTHTHMHPRHG